MNRKIRIRIFPDHANLLFQFIELADQASWPESWHFLRQQAQQLIAPVQESYVAILSVAEELAERGLLVLGGLLAEGHGLFREVEIETDLILLLEHEDREEVLQHLLSLLQRVSLLVGFDVRIWLGRHRSSSQRVIEEVHALYQRVFDEQGEQSRFFRRTNQRKQDPTQATNNGDADQENQDARRNSQGEGDHQAKGRRRKKRNGVMDSDPCRDLSESAQFFLQYTSLVWPCTESDLNRSWRHALHSSHPDKFPDDPHASNRTQLINSGYRELRAILLQQTPQEER